MTSGAKPEAERTETPFDGGHEKDKQDDDRDYGVQRGKDGPSRTNGAPVTGPSVTRHGSSNSPGHVRGSLDALIAASPADAPMSSGWS